MAEYTFTPMQCKQLLAAIERVRARRSKKRPLPTNIGRWEENRLKAYTEATARRRDMQVKDNGYSFTFKRGHDSISVALICVHDCGACVYYVYKLHCEPASDLAREVLELVDANPVDIDNPRIRSVRSQVYAGLAA